MSKTFDLWGGTPPDPAYVDDPAGGRARTFKAASPHAIFAVHEDFGNAVRFPGGSAGSAKFIIRFRAAINETAGSNERTIFTWRQAYWDGANWNLLSENDGSLKVHFRPNAGVSELDWTIRLPGQSFSPRRIRWSQNDVSSICDGSWHEYAWEVPMLEDGTLHYPKTFVDGVEVSSIQTPEWIDTALNLTHATETLVGCVFLGHSSQNAEFDISALSLEIKDQD